MWTFSSEFGPVVLILSTFLTCFVYYTININVAGIITNDMDSLVVQILNYIEKYYNNFTN